MTSARAGAAAAEPRSRSGGESAAEREGEEEERSALEEALDELGAFGLYQRLAVALLCLPGLLAACHSLSYVFVADRVPFRCLVPECEGSAGEFAAEAPWALLAADDACARLRPPPPPPPTPPVANGTCDAARYGPDTVACDRFLYETDDTIFVEFDLACREWQRTLVGSVRNSALPVALLLTGFVSDRYGRRTAFCVFAACAGALGVAKALAGSYAAFLALEWLEAALGYGFNSAAYVMVLELARPSLRSAFAAATGMSYGVGGALLALVAHRMRSWRRLLLAVHAPALLLPLYWLLLDESPRWLHARDRVQDAEAVIRKAARWNKVTLDESVMSRLGKEGAGAAAEGTEATAGRGGNPWAALLRSRPLLARLGACAWCWVAAAFVYYGLTINSVALAGDKYVNFALNMAMEVVASLFLVMVLERFGRRRSILAAFLVCGLLCITPFFVTHAATGLGLYMLGKLCVTFAFNALYMFTAELFPTRTRSSALAACSLVGRLGAVLAPQTPLLNRYVQAVLYGVVSLLAALAVLAAPETRRARLPPAVRAAERLRAPPPPAPAPPPPPAPRVLSAHS